jgi:CRP-like cAMP-binding protein
MRLCTPARLPVDLLLKLGKDVKTVLFCKNQMIFSRGDSSSHFLYIQNGSVKLTVTSARGKEAVIAVVDGGSFLGHGALVFDPPARSHDAVALTEVRAVKIEPKAMLHLMHNDEYACAAILSSMVNFEKQLVGNCADSLLYCAEERLARALLMISRWCDPIAVTPRVKLSQQDLANMIGVSRQRVNALLKELRRVGFIDDGLRVHKSIVKVVGSSGRKWAMDFPAEGDVDN